MRTIDADALWKEFCKSEAIEERYGSGVLEIIGNIIDNAPTIDAVPVVRCKDCRWFGKIGCAIEVVDETDMPKDNDFCSFAERRENE